MQWYCPKTVSCVSANTTDGLCEKSLLLNAFTSMHHAHTHSQFRNSVPCSNGIQIINGKYWHLFLFLWSKSSPSVNFAKLLHKKTNHLGMLILILDSSCRTNKGNDIVMWSASNLHEFTDHELSESQYNSPWALRIDYTIFIPDNLSYTHRIYISERTMHDHVICLWGPINKHKTQYFQSGLATNGSSDIQSVQKPIIPLTLQAAWKNTNQLLLIKFLQLLNNMQ